MWGAAALLFLAFARQLGAMDGHVFFISDYRRRRGRGRHRPGPHRSVFRAREAADVDDVRALRG